MPAHQGVGGDEEGRPTRPREKSTESRKHRPIGGPVADTSVELAFEDANLVAEHRDLELRVESELRHEMTRPRSRQRPR